MKQNLEIDDLIAYQALLDDICSKIHIVEQSKIFSRFKILHPKRCGTNDRYECANRSKTLQ